MKKALKVISITILVLLIIFIATPFLFKGKLEDLLKEAINKNVNAEVQWQSLDLSLLSDFPNASVELNKLSIINKEPFAGDTLASIKRFHIELGISQLLKNTDKAPIKIDGIDVDGAFINVLINEDGIANYDIAIEHPESSNDNQKEETSDPFILDFKKYAITNSKIDYKDLSSNMFLHLKDFNHKGSGDFSAISGELDTETSTTIAFEFDGVNYFDGTKLSLDAIFEMDLENQKYTFKENKALINELPLAFDGFVHLIEEGTDMDISFHTPNSDFKNFLAVIPSAYRSNIDDVQTKGDFSINGTVKGTSTDTTIPNLDITIASNNASFKFPDLVKQMSNINIDLQIKNDTGNIDQTYVDINQLRFKIDEDIFSVNGTLKNLTRNMLVNLALKGTINLGNLEKVYPLELENPLEGKLVADITTAFDMNSVEKHQYQNIKSSGTASLTNFKYTTDKLPNTLTIANAYLAFNHSTISLNDFNAKSGRTDINASGTIENLIPFVMSKEDLKGRFYVKSKVFDINDFSTTTAASETSTPTEEKIEMTASGESIIKIPDFLDASLQFSANKVIYDNLELSNTSGTLSIVNEQVELKDLTSGIFGGDAGITGNVSTKGATPTFDVKLDLKSIDIDKSFEGLDMLQSIAPIAKALQGAFNTEINLKGQLDRDLSPILSTISGDAFAQLLTADVSSEKMPLLSTLDTQLSFIDLDDLKLDKLIAKLSFKDGTVVVTPFNFDIEGITVNVSGGHSFNNEINYTLDLDVPAKYLGSDVEKVLSQLTAQERDGLHVEVPVSLAGSFNAPKVNVNTQSAISNLTTQIVEIQKQKIKDKAGNTVNDILSSVLGVKKDTVNDSTSIDPTTTTQNSTSSKPEDVVKDAAKDILGDLFGKKKQKETTKDTVN